MEDTRFKYYYIRELISRWERSATDREKNNDSIGTVNKRSCLLCKFWANDIGLCINTVTSTKQCDGELFEPITDTKRGRTQTTSFEQSLTKLFNRCECIRGQIHNIQLDTVKIDKRVVSVNETILDMIVTIKGLMEKIG